MCVSNNKWSFQKKIIDAGQLHVDPSVNAGPLDNHWDNAPALTVPALKQMQSCIAQITEHPYASEKIFLRAVIDLISLGKLPDWMSRSDTGLLPSLTMNVNIYEVFSAGDQAHELQCLGKSVPFPASYYAERRPAVNGHKKILEQQTYALYQVSQETDISADLEVLQKNVFAFLYEVRLFLEDKTCNTPATHISYYLDEALNIVSQGQQNIAGTNIAISEGTINVYIDKMSEIITGQSSDNYSLLIDNFIFLHRCLRSLHEALHNGFVEYRTNGIADGLKRKYDDVNTSLNNILRNTIPDENPDLYYRLISRLKNPYDLLLIADDAKTMLLTVYLRGRQTLDVDKDKMDLADKLKSIINVISAKYNIIVFENLLKQHTSITSIDMLIENIRALVLRGGYYPFLRAAVSVVGAASTNVDSEPNENIVHSLFRSASYLESMFKDVHATRWRQFMSSKIVPWAQKYSEKLNLKESSLIKTFFSIYKKQTQGNIIQYNTLVKEIGINIGQESLFLSETIDLINSILKEDIFLGHHYSNNQPAIVPYYFSLKADPHNDWESFNQWLRVCKGNREHFLVSVFFQPDNIN